MGLSVRSARKITWKVVGGALPARRQPARGHVGRPDDLDLLHTAKLLLAEKLRGAIRDVSRLFLLIAYGQRFKRSITQPMRHIFSSDLIEGGDDFVEDHEAGDAALVELGLGVEVHVVGHGGEHDGHVRVQLAVHLPGIAALGQVHVRCNVTVQSVNSLEVS